jgi:hypothetical protein
MKKLLLFILAIFITSCSNTFLSEYDNIGFENDERDIYMFYHNSDKYMTFISKYENGWDCFDYETDKTNEEISCSDEQETVCKIIKNASNLFIEECQFCDGNERYISTYEYSVSGDILTVKTSTDYLDGSDIEESSELYRRTLKTLESFECN